MGLQGIVRLVSNGPRSRILLKFLAVLHKTCALYLYNSLQEGREFHNCISVLTAQVRDFKFCITLLYIICYSLALSLQLRCCLYKSLNYRFR